MYELIKQVFKSFKKSIVLLIGLLFIGFAIIFAFFSSLYFTSNINHSYSSLNSASNLGTTIVPTTSDDLNESTLSYDIDGIFSNFPDGIKQKTVTSDDATNPSTSLVYFTSYDDKVNSADLSFAYQPTYLLHSSFVKSPDTTKSNYIFAYYSSSTTDNPFFTDPQINDPNYMYYKRARGILYSYGNAVTPSTTDSSLWRAWALSLDTSDLQNIVYAVNPLTGETEVDSSGFATTLGYFDDGYLDNSIALREGNMIYPSNVTAATATDVTTDNAYRLKNENVNTPFFISGKSWWVPNMDWDLKQSTSWILNQLKTGADVFNLLPSMSVNLKVSIPLTQDINWDLAQFTPYYEYLKILRDSNYLTKNGATTNAANKPANGIDITESKDFIFNVHLNTTSLTNLEKQTLAYVKNTYGSQVYDNLVSFTYTCNATWIKQKLASYVYKDENVTNSVNANSFNTLIDLSTSYELLNGESISGKSIISNWIQNYSQSKLASLETNLENYEREYIAKDLSSIANIKFNNQKSFTIDDSKTSITYLVSRKDFNQEVDKNQSGDVNKLVMTSGTKLQNSYKYLDIANSLFDTVSSMPVPTIVPNSANDLNIYNLNPNGNYLMNLVEFTNKSVISGITDTPISQATLSDYQVVQNLLSEILNQYGIGDNPSTTTPTVPINDYYHLFSIVTPNIFSSNIITTNRQNIDLSFQVKWGVAPTHFLGSVSYATPYGSAVIVTQKWLEANNKSIVSPDEWKKAVDMSSADYQKWLIDLDSSKKIVINSENYAIIGTGISAENAYPVTSLTSTLPNYDTESLIYVNDQAYNSILATSLISEDNYFSVASTNGSSNLGQVQAAIGDLTTTPYASNDIKNHKNLLTMRIGIPNELMKYIQIFSVVLIVAIILIGIYLCYLLIKIYIEKNQISLAIAKANGVSSLKIIFSLSMFGLVVSLISGIVGYFTALSLQNIFLNVISSYWFIPISIHLFSPLGFLGGAVIIYIAFLLFVSIGVWRTFRNPINDLLSKTTELKINKFLHFFKYSLPNMDILLRFRIALSFAKMNRFILLVLLCSIGISFISTGISIPDKFHTSQSNTENSLSYKYSFDLNTPTQQSGLYKIQDYSDLGITNDSAGIYSIYSNLNYTGYSDPYNVLFTSTDQNQKDLLALRDSTGNVIDYKNEDGSTYHKYFTNLIMPSYTCQFGIRKDPQFFRNVVVSKWLLDFTITISSLSLNIWDYVSNSFPSDLVSKINALSNDFINSILSTTDDNGNKYLAQLNQIGSGTESDPKPFLSETSGIWSINSANVMSSLDATDLESIRFNDAFLKFIGMVYGNKELSDKDSKLAFGVIPEINWNESTSETESYTYLNTILESPSSKLNDSNNPQGINLKIVGIKENSKYVSLYDANGNDLNSLLFQKPLDSNSNQVVYPIVINVGSSYKYNLSKGDIFKVWVTNTFDRYSKKLVGENSLKEISFKVVGISQDSFGTQFYTSQNFANEILGLNFDQGAIIYGTSKMTDYKTIESTILGDTSLLSSTSVVDTNVINQHTFKVSVLPTPSNYVPFNGIFSHEDNPLQTSSLSLLINSGIWGNYSYFKDGSTINTQINDYFTSGNTTYSDLLNWVLPYDTNTLMNMVETLKTTNASFFTNPSNASLTTTIDATNVRQVVLSCLLDKYSSNASVTELLQNVFGNNNMVAINNMTFFNTLFNTYGTIFNSLLTVESMIVILIVPIIIFTIMIVSSTTLNDFRKMLAVLKTLGYTNKEILSSIALSYLLILIISIGIGVAILVALLFSFQSVVFGLSTIYLSSSINFIPYLIGTSGIMAILIVNIIYVILLFKKQNLKNSIN